MHPHCKLHRRHVLVIPIHRDLYICTIVDMQLHDISSETAGVPFTQSDGASMVSQNTGFAPHVGKHDAGSQGNNDDIHVRSIG